MSVRRATHAGSWYDRQAEKLDSQLSAWLQNAESSVPFPSSSVPASSSNSSLAAIIGPHAGYSYSGDTASYAYSRLLQENKNNDIKRIFILGPSHHTHLRKCSISGCAELETPLGNLLVDSVVRDELVNSGQFEVVNLDVEEEEHSIEMHLPYVSKVMRGNSNFTVVPIMVDALNEEQMEAVACLLAQFVDSPGNVFIISSDFCHWGRRFRYQPYDESKGAICQFITELDGEAMRILEDQNRLNFAQYLKRTNNTICGRHPIMLFLAVMEKSAKSFSTKFTHYAQSSAVTDLADSSVSYASAVIERL